MTHIAMLTRTILRERESVCVCARERERKRKRKRERERERESVCVPVAGGQECEMKPIGHLYI